MNSQPSPHATDDVSGPWYRGVTRYQWLVLLIASLGWVFDVFEGQLFVASMPEAMPELLGEQATVQDVAYYNNISLGAFLIGGALGGVLFGMLSDRIGRTRTMILTILIYSAFTCVTAFAQTWWQMALLRFIVALGVGGEWAVASAMVAEVFPPRSRAWSGAIFHGSSVLGTYLAIAAGEFVIGNPEWGWRWAFVLGAIPALLTLWIRWQLKEPEAWTAARERARTDHTQATGRIADLFAIENIRATLAGVCLAAVGLATFWGVHIYGKDTLRLDKQRELLTTAGVDWESSTPAERDEVLGPQTRVVKRAEMWGMFLVTTGGGVGLLSFAPICSWLGRRRAFMIYHVGGLAMGLILFGAMRESHVTLLTAILPLFGFLTLGMHAGYAIYFPELFPTRLRSTGAGFCFNVGRVIAAPILFLSGWLQKSMELSLHDAATLLSSLFLLGLVVLIFAPETKGRDLPT
jgi:MFS family permease